MSNHDLSAYNGGPDAITKHLDHDQLKWLADMKDEPLHPDLVPYIEEGGAFGPMLRHPLVYDLLPGGLPGLTNRTYLAKREALAEAQDAGDWHTVVFLHEKPYRLNALIDWVTGRDEDGRPVTLGQHVDQDTLDLVADVWVDAENIEQMIHEWRALFGSGREIWLGREDERLAFNALPEVFTSYRAGIEDGDWSWTTNLTTAQFFAGRFRDTPLPIMRARINKDQCFGYLTRRGEAEVLVRTGETIRFQKLED